MTAGKLITENNIKQNQIKKKEAYKINYLLITVNFYINKNNLSMVDIKVYQPYGTSI